MAVYKRDMVDINLETGNIHRSFLKHSIGFKDAAADHFGIRVFRNGEPVSLTGVSVQGIFMPPQGSPIAITSGNIVSENEAEVVLPQACYNYDGQFTLSIKLVDATNAVTGTMRIVDGMVDNTHASGTVAPTSAVPTYQEILATYDAMVAATTAATTAATNVGSIVAAAYSTSATYAVGDYCTKDGNLYRCTTAITTAESWTAAHWTQTKMGPDVSDLKSAIGIVPSGTTVENQIKGIQNGKINKPLDEHSHPYDGTAGQLLRTKGDGSTEWANVGQPTDEQTAEAVTAWLDEHPEATTTVQDGSLTLPKFTDGLKNTVVNYYVKPEKYGAVGDGIADDTDAIQRCIDENPNATVLFENKYLVSEPIVTSATESEKVFLQLDSKAVIKASSNFDGEYVVIIAGKGTMPYLQNCHFVTGISGGTIDTNQVCGGIKIADCQQFRMTDINVVNVVTVGVYVAVMDSSIHHTSSTDGYIDKVIVIGAGSNISAGCTGFIIEGHDNDIRNIRATFVNIGVVVSGTHNRIANAHPVRGGADSSNNYEVYLQSKAFVINSSLCVLEDCYSDNFATGLYFNIRSASIFISNFTILWWENLETLHRFIYAVDGTTPLLIKISNAEITFPSNGQNVGIDAQNALSSIMRDSLKIENPIITQRATLGSSDPLNTLFFKYENRVAYYNYISDVDNAIIEEIMYYADNSSSNKPTATGTYLIWNKKFDGTYITQFATLVNTGNPKTYIRSKYSTGFSSWYIVYSENNLTGDSNTVTDCNDAIVPGIVYSTRASADGGCLNTPDTRAYTITAEKRNSNFIVQKATLQNSAIPETYYRTLQNDTWNSWERVNTDKVGVVTSLASLVSFVNSMALQTGSIVFCDATTTSALTNGDSSAAGRGTFYHVANNYIDFIYITGDQEGYIGRIINGSLSKCQKMTTTTVK